VRPLLHIHRKFIFALATAAITAALSLGMLGPLKSASAETATWSGVQALANFTVYRPTNLQGLMPATKNPLDASFCSPRKSAVRVVYGASELKKDGNPMLIILQDNAKTPCWDPNKGEQKVSAQEKVLGSKAEVRSGPLSGSKKNPFGQVQLSIDLPGTGKYKNTKTRLHLTGFNGVTTEQLLAIANSLKPL
jgi:hypothetical protein